MIKKIRIIKLHKTIQKDFELELEQMTVITGENNSGKTNFIQAINSRKDTKFTNAEFLDANGVPLTPSIVYIAAENINPSDSESKSSAKTTGLIKNLSELFSNLGIKFEVENKEEIKGYIKNLIDKTNKNLQGFVGHDKHELSLDLNENELEPAIILQAIIKNIAAFEDIIGDGNEKEMELDDLGQGTQRIIVASILKAYIDILVEGKKHTEKPILILFEEPEIYLHPRLKRTLNATLGNIANQPNYQVVITTHDPYFAYTNLKDEDSVIYSFFRDEKGNTDKKEPNVIFGIDDELLHIHLFEKVLRKAHADKIISGKYSMDQDSPLDKYLKGYCNGEIRDNVFPSGKTHSLALPLHIRHVIHHPFDVKNKFNDDDLEKSIKILNKILGE